MLKTLTLAALLAVSSLASAATLGPSSCTSPANNTFCMAIPNDSPDEIDFARVVYPQVYLGNNQYQPAYEAMTVTVAGVDYTTTPWGFSAVKTPTGLKDADWRYTGTAYSAGGLPMTFDVYIHQHDGTAGGRVARTIHQYSFLHGVVL